MKFLQFLSTYFRKKVETDNFDRCSFMPAITVLRGSSARPGADGAGAGLALFQPRAAPALCPPAKLCADICLWALCAVVRPNPGQKVTRRNEISKPVSAAGPTGSKRLRGSRFCTVGLMVHIHKRNCRYQWMQQVLLVFSMKSLLFSLEIFFLRTWTELILLRLIVRLRSSW